MNINSSEYQSSLVQQLIFERTLNSPKLPLGTHLPHEQDTQATDIVKPI